MCHQVGILVVPFVVGVYTVWLFYVAWLILDTVDVCWGGGVIRSASNWYIVFMPVLVNLVYVFNQGWPIQWRWLIEPPSTLYHLVVYNVLHFCILSLLIMFILLRWPIVVLCNHMLLTIFSSPYHLSTGTPPPTSRNTPVGCTWTWVYVISCCRFTKD